MDELLVFPLAFFGAAFSGVFGFGASLTFITLGSFFFPIKYLVALTVFFGLNPFIRTYFYWHSIHWKLALQIALGSTIGAIFGTQIFVGIAPALLEKIVGIMLLLYLFSVVQKKKNRPSHTPPVLTIMGISSVYGIISGLSSSGNPIKVALVDHIGLRKEAFVGTLGLSSIFTALVKLVAFSHYGFLDWESRQSFFIGFLLCAIAGSVLGSVLHIKKLKKLHPEGFRMVILGFLGLMAFKMLLGG